MRSLWNERAILIDAEQVTLRAPVDSAEDGLMCRHDGDPAAAVGALLGAVKRRQPRWRNRLHVWLGYPWTQTQLLPWQSGLSGGESHWRIYAQALLRERGVSGELRVRLSPARYGRSRLAYAVDADVLDALERKTRELGWRIASCRDLLSSSLQSHRRLLRQTGPGLVVAEAGALTCLWGTQDSWDDMITLQWAPDQSAAAAVATAEALCGRTGTPGYFWASTTNPRQLPMAPQAQWLGFPHPMLAVRP